MSGTNPLFETPPTADSWGNAGWGLATTPWAQRFRGTGAGTSGVGHTVAQGVGHIDRAAREIPGGHGFDLPMHIHASAAAPMANTSSLSLSNAGEMVVLDIEPAQVLVTGLDTLVGEVLQFVLTFKGYPYQAPVLSNPTTRPRDLPTSDATAFSNAEVVRTTSEPKLVQHLLRYLKFYFRPNYGAALASRIESLAQAVREDDDGLELSGMSVAHLIGFLERNPSVLRPKLAAGPSGEVLAFWRDESRGEFSARFLPNGSVRFLLTLSDPDHPEGMSRSSGDTTLDKLFARAGLADLAWVNGARPIR